MAEPVRTKKIAAGVRVLITVPVVIAAILVGIWAYRFYEYTPWTRDGRVSVYVVDTAPEVSGQVMQKGTTRNMIFECRKIVSYLSHFMTLSSSRVPSQAARFCAAASK